jgi:hypothetical protein
MIGTIQDTWLAANEAHRPKAKFLTTYTLLHSIALYYILLHSIRPFAAYQLTGRGNSGAGTIYGAREKSKKTDNRNSLPLSTFLYPILPYSSLFSFFAGNLTGIARRVVYSQSARRRRSMPRPAISVIRAIWDLQTHENNFGIFFLGRRVSRFEFTGE